MRIDPDGLLDWKPDRSGYYLIAESGDNASTLAAELGISLKQAELKLMNQAFYALAYEEGRMDNVILPGQKFRLDKRRTTLELTTYNQVSLGISSSNSISVVKMPLFGIQQKSTYSFQNKRYTNEISKLSLRNSYAGYKFLGAEMRFYPQFGDDGMNYGVQYRLLYNHLGFSSDYASFKTQFEFTAGSREIGFGYRATVSMNSFLGLYFNGTYGLRFTVDPYEILSSEDFLFDSATDGSVPTFESYEWPKDCWFCNDND